MKNMFFLLLFLPFFASAQVYDADKLLDKAVEAMKKDSPLQMDYSYTVYDETGDEVLEDKGVMRLDGNRYSVVMDKMGVWCDGKTQWSYMLEIDEIYITGASSDEAQNLSPLFIMENYSKGSSKTAVLQDGMAVLTLQSMQDNTIEKVELYVDSEAARLKAMNVFMPGQGHIEIMLDKYQIKCNFADDVYRCPVEEYSTAEVVDMR